MTSVSIFKEQVDYFVRLHFSLRDEAPEEAEVRKKYESAFDLIRTMDDFSDLEMDRDAIVDSLVKQYCRELIITKRPGFAYKDDESKPWLSDVEKHKENLNNWFYWNRYCHYLASVKQWPLSAVKAIERDTWNILDLMADPRQADDFERRGLVVASVQSGKTANYSGLVCRAADAGYRIIIVLAGVHNILRSQTQVRLEEAFAGFDITTNECVGVGAISREQRPILCTSRDTDFNKQRASGFKGIQTAHTNDPWLFVIKKNSNSLRRVFEWLRDNANQDDSLLIIDDEADNASINGNFKTGQRRDEPTRINGQIRKILNYFRRKCYIGYTATPFANILIDPRIDSDEYGKDLFPRNFIYTLEDSSDYFGSEKVFGGVSGSDYPYLRYIDDIDSILPPKHNRSFEVTTLPESLKFAVRCFLLSLAVRKLRGDGDEHCTMMVNVTPYTRIQQNVADLIDEYLKKVKDAVYAYGALDVEQALVASDEIRLLRQAWLSEYENLGFSWSDILSVLNDAIFRAHTTVVNSKSSGVLEYAVHTEHVIAVGGYRLSRGLTLEGLVVSYYSRNAKAYDALMQMARWFGYRPRYEDLCRIWMSRKTAGWYRFVADATADLFDELRNMRQVSRTPQNYGLRIRQCPDSLTVTARNKMGTGTAFAAPIDLNNGFIETIAFERSAGIVQSNKQAVRTLLSGLLNFKSTDADFYRGVPVEEILSFIDSYINEDAKSPKSQKRPVLNYIRDRLDDGELHAWDVYLAGGEGEEVELSNGIVVRREIRYPGSETNGESLVVGEKHRLASRGVEKKGLDEVQRREAEAEFLRDHPDKSNPSDLYYRRHRRYPLLVIHPVQMKYTEEQRARREEGGASQPDAGSWPSWDHSEEAYGWSISFPQSAKQTRTVEYLFNQVAVESMTAEFTEESDDNTDDD